jgi:hypothetical protein
LQPVSSRAERVTRRNVTFSSRKGTLVRSRARFGAPVSVTHRASVPRVEPVGTLR